MERIKLGVAHRGAGVAPLFAAFEGGYLREQGLEAELVATPGHGRALEALHAGEVHFINSVGVQVIQFDVRHGADAVVVASAISRGAQQVAARPGIASREDLRGKRWGVIERHDADECCIAMAFERWHWDLAKDATIVPVGSGAPRLDLLLDERRVDAAIMHAPEPFQAAKRGWPVVEDLSRLDWAFQNSCAVTTGRLLKQQPDTVLRYVRAYCQGVNRFRTDAGFGIDLLRKYTGEADARVIEQSWLLFARLMGGMMYPSLEGMRAAGNVLHRLGAIPAPVAPEAFVALEPVAAAEREGFFMRIMGAGAHG